MRSVRLTFIRNAPAGCYTLGNIMENLESIHIPTYAHVAPRTSPPLIRRRYEEPGLRILWACNINPSTAINSFTRRWRMFGAENTFEFNLVEALLPIFQPVERINNNIIFNCASRWLLTIDMDVNSSATVEALFTRYPLIALSTVSYLPFTFHTFNFN